MPTKTTAGIIADLMVQTGGSVRSEKAGQLALVALQKAVDHAPSYNFREQAWQDLTGIPQVNAWDSQRFEITGRDIVPLPADAQHVPANLGGYKRIGVYYPNFATLEPGIGVDGAVKATVTTLCFDAPVPGPVGPDVQRLVSTGPLTAGTYTLTHTTTTAAINFNDPLTTVQTRLNNAGIPYTAVGGPLTTPWNVGFIATAPGVSGAFSVTSSAVGGTLSIESVQVGSTPAAAATKVRFWFYRRALLPAADTDVIPLDDVYLDVAPLMFMHELLSSAQLGGDQANHAYRAGELKKTLLEIKRNRTNVRINNKGIWRSYDGAMGGTSDTRVRRRGWR